MRLFLEARVSFQSKNETKKGCGYDGKCVHTKQLKYYVFPKKDACVPVIISLCIYNMFTLQKVKSR